MSINRITKSEFSEEDWLAITDDWYDDEKEYRRGQSFYITLYFHINDEVLPNRPELHGFWMTDEGLTWSDDWGLDDKVTSLVRVEKRKKVIETEEWHLVK